MARVALHLHNTDDSHRVTTLELLFDLVFVYAITQVTTFLSHDPSGLGLARGLVLLALLWFAWTAYAWLGNQAKADEGPVRLGLIAAMAGLFVAALAMPEAFHDEPGGLHGPLVFAAAYAVVRLVHLAVYLVAAGDDADLRRQLGRAALVMIPPLGLLVIGAAVGPPWQLWWWLAAVAIDYGGVFATGAQGWRVHAPHHFAERHGLVIIIAIGESIISIGVGLAGAPVSLGLLTGSVLGLAIAVCLWWTYFDVVAPVAERTLRGLRGQARAAMARDSYTYLHLPMVAGIVLLALGIKTALRQAAAVDSHAVAATLPAVATWGLYAGTALYLLSHVAFRLRNVGTFNWHRSIVATLLLLAAVTAQLTDVDLPALGQLAIVAGLLTGLICYEAIRFAQTRDAVRHPEPAA